MSGHKNNTTPTSPDDAGLEAFFAAGRADATAPGPDLMARVMADAMAETDTRALYAGERRHSGRGHTGLLASALAAIGGWPSAAALASVAAAGVWIGAAVPDAVGTLAFGWSADATEYDYVELLPDLNALDAEG